MRPLPTVSDLCRGLRYDPDSGNLYWVRRDDRTPLWNNRYADKIAGKVNADGYISVLLEGRDMLAHRVAYKIHHGVDPEIVDHINGDRRDNRACNLRSVCAVGNSKNRRLPSNNTSGECGVIWNRRLNKWVSQVSGKGVPRKSKSFANFQDAVDHARGIRAALGFHHNHGGKTNDH